MAPTRTVKSKPLSKNGKSSKGSGKPSASGANTKSKVSKKPKGPPPKQHKTKSAVPTRKKKRVYTEKELGIPKLNMITPVGVELPKGKKKGKVFADDQESMMTILAIVNADKAGQLESKMMKSRQMEDIREARRKEAEARQEQRRSKLEETKDSMRKKRRRKSNVAVDTDSLESSSKPLISTKATRKRVSFA